MRAGFRHDDLVSVGVDDEGGVVGDDDDLALAFGRDKERTSSSKRISGSRFSSGWS